MMIAFETLQERLKVIAGKPDPGLVCDQFIQIHFYIGI